MKKCRIVFFSLNEKRRSHFQLQLEKNLGQLMDYYCDDDAERRALSFLMQDSSVLPAIDAKSIFDLKRYLEAYKDRLSDLYLIVDYLSLSGKKLNQWERNAQKVRETILEYPEVNFFFDESLTVDKGISFLDFLLCEDKFEVDLPDESQKMVSRNIKEWVEKGMHSFDIAQSDALVRMCFIKDNMFDASNLRFVLKMKKYDDLNVEAFNFVRLQQSRSRNLALCVEEERSQSLFDSYAAYANGYRSLPVVTSLGLQWANENVSPQIIFRDFDLQFPDEIEGNTNIHMIRGWKRSPWSKHCGKDSHFWSKLDTSDNEINKANREPPIIYISKGEDDVRFSLTGAFQQEETIAGHLLKLPGMYKPISGIYSPFLDIKAVKKVFDGSRDVLPISTKRKNGDHGVPLDIYYSIKSMIDRSDDYYKQERYVHSALLAQDAMEMTNGFHEALMISAYRRKVMAENAIAANILGGDEAQLQGDTEFRINHLIAPEVNRLIHGRGESGQNYDKKRNILNQIYNDIRIFCQQREHFDAEDSVVGAMGHLNDGIAIRDLFKRIKKEKK